jgi:hypothetical protein
MHLDRARGDGRKVPLLHHPGVIATAVALLGILAMLIVDHGPWARPRAQPAHMAMYRTTGEAARAAGAKVISTEPKREFEPATSGPRPGQPINPVSPP